MYPDQLPTFDSVCGLFRLHPTENSFYQICDDKTVLLYELTPDGKIYRLEDLTEVDPAELHFSSNKFTYTLNQCPIAAPIT